MTNVTDHNPLAFAAVTEETYLQQGMSLRDYFAAKALQAAYSLERTHDEYDEQCVAEEVYKMADAMLEERKK